MRDSVSTVIGIHQIAFEGAITDKEFENRSRQMLARCLNSRHVVAFVGSGISRAWGYPDWPEFSCYAVFETLKYLGKTDASALTQGRVELEILRGFLRANWGKETNKALEARQNEAPKDLQDWLSNIPRAGHQSEYRPPPTVPDRIVVALELCEEVYLRINPSEGSKNFRSMLATLVRGNPANKQTLQGTRDPLQLILKTLGIQRFLTINYDDEIEKAFKRVLAYQKHPEDENHPEDPSNVMTSHSVPVHWQKGEVRRNFRSLSVPSTIRDDRTDRLAQFAVKAPGFECGVFHLHGHKDDSKTMVVTERDYQRVYLQSGELRRPYADALRIVFAGNPVIFLGVGMEEQDLLRPLRQFVSEEYQGGYERPLFALLDRPANRQDAIEKRKFMHTKYGVKVLYYDQRNGEDKTQSFCCAIKELATDWRTWWAEWRDLPEPRRPVFSPTTDKKGIIRHQIEWKPLFKITKEVNTLKSKLVNPGGRYLLYGQSGQGKGSIGQFLVAPDTGNYGGNPPWIRRYDKRFFATAHFTNDLLSMVEAAARFFCPNNREPDPIQLLKKALSGGKNLFVLGGLERLLVPVLSSARSDDDTQNPQRKTSRPGRKLPRTYPLNEPMTPEVRRFLKMLDGLKQPKSTVVLTTSVERVFCLDCFTLVRLHGVGESVVTESELFKNQELEKTEVQRLYNELHGHAYALSVIGHVSSMILKISKEEGLAERASFLERISLNITVCDSGSRPLRVIQLAIQEVERLHIPKTRRGSTDEPEPSLQLGGILQRVALFSTPIPEEVILACYDDSELSGETVEERKAHIEKFVKEGFTLLKEVNLLLEVRTIQKYRRVTAHTLVRMHELRLLGGGPSTPGEAQRFDVTGWSTESPDTHSENARSHQFATACADRLLAKLATEDNPILHREYARAAFGLIRSRWTATTIPRLGGLPVEASIKQFTSHYDAYTRRLALLINAARKPLIIAKGKDSSSSSGGDWSPEVAGVFYREELAWLYNEFAIAAFCQGRMQDADAMLRQARTVALPKDTGGDQWRWCEFECNRALILLERGLLREAESALDIAFLEATALPVDRQVAARIEVHLGLVLHLTGNYTSALDRYNRSIDVLEKTTHSTRALSIAYRHRADLQRKLENYREAAADIMNSIAAAEAGRSPDLLLYSRIAHNNLLRAAEGSKAVSIEELAAAVNFARHLGSPKLELDAIIAQGQVALEEEQLEMAERLAHTALAAAASLDLRLRLTGSLMLLGKVFLARGKFNEATELFRSALDLAERQHYQLLIDKLDVLLTKVRNDSQPILIGSTAIS